MILNSHNVKINLMDTSSTSENFKECFTYSILDHIQRILNNPSIYPKLYFGPGVESEEKSELWHGQLWKESPIFGVTTYKVENGINVLYIFFFDFLYLYGISLKAEL